MKYLLILLVLLSSCVTQQRCAEKFPPTTHITETIKEVVKDSILPPTTVVDTFLLSEIEELPIDRWISVEDTSGKAELRIMKTKYNQLILECKKKEEIIQNQRIERTIDNDSDQLRTVIKTPKWAWYSLILNAIVVSFVGLRFYLKLPL